LETPFFVGIPLALALQKQERMLDKLKRRCAMSPLMLMLLLSLVPFPILVLAIIADRWLKSAPKTIS
jgi:hypothetical protein